MRKPDPKIQTLMGLELFSGCDRTELALIAQLADITTVPAGTVLVTEGRPGTQCLAIVDGFATVTANGQRVAMLGRGEVFGELSLLTREPRNATVTATTPLTILALDPRSFSELLRAVPAVQARIRATAASRTLAASAR